MVANDHSRTVAACLSSQLFNGVQNLLSIGALLKNPNVPHYEQTGLIHGGPIGVL